MIKQWIKNLIAKNKVYTPSMKEVVAEFKENSTTATNVIPEPKYSEGSRVYISVGNLLLIGEVINVRYTYKKLLRVEYLVKYDDFFKDGMTHGEWHYATDLSNITEVCQHK